MSVSLIDGHIDEPTMTDEQIKYALERCSIHKECCYCNAVEECGIKKVLTDSVLDLIKRQRAEIDILIRKKETLQDEVAELQLKIKNCISEKDDLNIELQAIKAENEMLTEKVEALGDPIEFAQYELFELREENRELHKICNQAIKTYKETKAEAIKEFAERLKEHKHECGCNYRKKPVYAVTVEKIDNLVKEMVGE